MSTGTCACVAIMAWMFGGRWLSTKCGDNLNVLTGRPESVGGGRTDSVTGLLVNQKLADALLLGEWRTCYQFCFNSVITACGWGGWLLRPPPPPRICCRVVRWRSRTLLSLCDVRQGKRILGLLEPHGWLFGIERRGTTTDAGYSESRIRRLLRPYWWVSVLLYTAFAVGYGTYSRHYAVFGVTNVIVWVQITRHTHTHTQLYVHITLFLPVRTISVAGHMLAACLSRDSL